MVECLHGKMASKGFAKAMNTVKRKLLKSNRFREMKLSKYSYSICYDINEVKRQQEASSSYPLVLYMRLYKEKSSLTIIEKLLLPEFNRKQLKRRYNTLLKINHQQIETISKNTPKYHEILFLFQYYQPLWKEITKLQHGDILSYLLSKIFINCYEIKIMEEQTTKQKSIKAHIVCHHFIRYYILNSPNLLENETNKLIINTLLDCKENEKSVGIHKINDELIKSLCDFEKFYSSKDFLVVIFR